jgi:signal transduction histidine kinase
MNENKFMIEKLVDVLDKKNTNNINDYQIEKNKEIIKKNFRNIKENKTIYAYIINIFMNFFLFIIFFLSLNYFRKSLIVPINEVTENLKNLSSGNFILKFNYRSKNELGEINEAIRAMASHLGFDIAYKNLTDIEINNSKNKIKLVEQKLEFTKQINHLQRIDTIGRMTAGISHNFNNILASIIGYNDLNIFMIEKSSDKILKDEIMDNSNQICIASNKGASLIRSMMVFSNQNLTNRKIKIKKTSIVINDILVLIKPILNKCIKINTKINTDLVIEIDEIELHQILMNLIINSRDSIKNEGSIDINLEKVLINGKCISCLQHIKGDFLVLTVQDNGSGISDDLMDKIFEPFFTTKEVGKGTGLGLASVSGLVHESNGHIIINSQTGIKNSGTKFKLIFPI